MSILFKNIKSLVGVRPMETKVLKGDELKNLPAINDAWLYAEDGKISEYGAMQDFSSQFVPDNRDNSELEEVDCTGKFILPCFCDSHTHLVFADWRQEEFVNKIGGMSYEEIAARGGGILNSAKKLNETSEEVLLEKSLQRIEEIKNHGTGAVEIKSGYGLSYDGELKMLRVIQKLKSLSPIPVKATFLGAHAIPAEYKERREEYIKLLIDKLLPKIAEENLADYCDVFCENGFFTPEETDLILQAGWKYGLKPKIHANQLSISGGVQAGVRNNAISVDHLENIGDEEIEVLKNSITISTLLPSAAFFLRMNYPPARRMIDAGLPVTLASDYNPGSSPSGRMSFVISLACIQMKMVPEEAINAATLNGAAAIELQNELGSITVGKKANLILTKPINSVANIPYNFGDDLIEKVFLGN
ncbi:MAG TPA: imidazolonepropionase [Chitinophagales bacterium]|nr:imidazolonepropionase [Chitinophagales bacterium]